jgi:hypothetical protein
MTSSKWLDSFQKGNRRKRPRPARRTAAPAAQ